jgi:hypothetical protein
MSIERSGESSHIKRPDEEKEKDRIDPDKFKKILEVESSTEKEKRKKKQPEEEIQEIEEHRKREKRLKSKPTEQFQPKSGGVTIQENIENTTIAVEGPHKTSTSMSESKDHSPNRSKKPGEEKESAVPTKKFKIKKSKTKLRSSKKDTENTSAIPPVDEVEEIAPAVEEDDSFEEETSPADIAIKLAKDHPEEMPQLETTRLPNVEPINNNMVSHLSTDLYSIFEKISAHLTMQGSSLEGVLKITLNMPHSVFDESTITLTHYATQPGAFHIQLEGNPEAAELFNNHLKNLQGALVQAHLSSEIHINPAVIASYKNKKPLFHRKEKLK